MKKIKIGIIGSAGYTAGELIRLLINHPNIEIKYLYSKSHLDQYVYQVHTDLFYLKNKFVSYYDDMIDVLFLCSGHGKSKTFLKQFNCNKNLKIIDLSEDFRIDNTLYHNGYIRNFTYGLTELNKNIINESLNIANPGCFATLIQLSVLPLLNKFLIESDLHVTAITGSTGSGYNSTSKSHFSWRNNNISTYKVFTHQHLKEIYNNAASDFRYNINFIPYRGNFTRGIYSSLYFQSDLDIKKVIKLYKDYYNDSFVYISDSDIDLKQVINTNYCLLKIDKYKNNILVTGCIDNLIKGASGQAIQNMNTMFNFDQRLGLNIKANAY
ncbi:MAG: N-acetyl-gamma-glutamyl-phosphate reductase [Bacteroides sp.]|nr:MAG: N-acetyl-gamma-glutamyl-phosphate reductase [Bacteroides sp.]